MMNTCYPFYIFGYLKHLDVIKNSNSVLIASTSRQPLIPQELAYLRMLTSMVIHYQLYSITSAYNNPHQSRLTNHLNFIANSLFGSSFKIHFPSGNIVHENTLSFPLVIYISVQNNSIISFIYVLLHLKYLFKNGELSLELPLPYFLN